MSLAQWRQFNFFDKQQVNDTDEVSTDIFKKQDIQVVTSGRGHAILSDSTGQVHIVDRNFKVQTFTAFQGGRITHMKQLKQKNILITIGEEDDTQHTTVIKVWDLDSAAKRGAGGSAAAASNASPSASSTASVSSPRSPASATTTTTSTFQPLCTRSIKIPPGEHPFPVTTMAIVENMSLLAIGLGNGTVLLYRLDLLKDKITKKLIYDGQEPITGLVFREQTKSTILFITTTTSILSYNTSASKPTIVTLDEQGCGLGCAIMTDAQEMVVGRDEAIYFYDPTGRGPCLAYDAPKSYLLWFKTNYLIIVSPHTNAPARSSDLTKVTVFDTVNKFVAYVGTFPGGIRGVFCEWNGIWVVGHDGKVYRLDEKDTPTKLEILFKLNLYVLAINLAHMQKYDAASIADIFKKYGDHLYTRANYDGAMDQYIRTIGQLEPSYVIRKYLDAQRIYNLTNYLQDLHAKGLANADHTTLLLNCYTKLKDVSRLDQFIKTDADYNFDLETAINVCRQAGYYEHAVYLAKKFDEHDLYLDIAIEDMRDYDTAVDYIRQLSSSEADKQLQKYSKTLLSHLPDATTQLLVDLCTGQLTIPSKDDAASKKSKSEAASAVSAGGNEQVSTFYHPPSARAFMPSFVDRPDYLARFLEQILEWRWKRTAPAAAVTTSPSVGVPNGIDSASTAPVLSRQEEEERKAIWNTLLELYLMDEQQTNADPSHQRRWQRSKEFKTKALALLKDDQVQYDTNQALMLCQLKKFDEGIVYLYNKTGMYADILRFWMEKQETDRVIEAVRKYGPKDASIYPLVLTYFSSTPEILAKSTPELLTVLRHIDEQDLLPPIQVVQALSRSNVATIGLIKDYIGRKIDEERKESEQNQALIQSYREETEKRRKEIDELKTSARIFQVQKCSGCGGMLDLPTVHFLCRHSFHQRCLGENDNECPQCSVQHRMISDIRRAQEANAERHDLFFDQLDNDDNGFSVIADYFSKNTMMFAKLID